MDIYPLGHSSFKVKGKNATVVLDPFDSSMVGLKFPKIEGVDLVTISHGHQDHNSVGNIAGDPFVITGPGEYEVKGVTVVGISSYHDDKKGEERGANTVYVLTIDGVRIVHLGDLGHKLTDEQVDEIGSVDILLIPVGGTFTISAKVAAEVVAQLEPSIVIPMHYQRAGLSAELAKELTPVSDFLKEMGVEGVATESKLTTSKDKLPENTTVLVLE